MNMRAIILAAALVASVFAAQADATTCTLTTFPASGILTADRINQRLSQVQTCVNGRIGNNNWNTAEPLQNTNLANPNALFSQTFTYGEASNAADVTAANNVRQWRVPISATVTAITGVAHGCTACVVTVTFQKDAVTIATLLLNATLTTVTNFAVGGTVLNTNDLNIDVSGTVTGVKSIDVVIYYKAQHQT